MPSFAFFSLPFPPPPAPFFSFSPRHSSLFSRDAATDLSVISLPLLPLSPTGILRFLVWHLATRLSHRGLYPEDEEMRIAHKSKAWCNCRHYADKTDRYKVGLILPRMEQERLNC